MNAILNGLLKIPGALIVLIVLFAVMFSPDGVEFGREVWPATPEYVSTLATIFGNCLWVGGIVAMVFAFLIVIADDSDIRRHVKDRAKRFTNEKDLLKHFQMTVGDYIVIYSGLVISFFAVGSGFWFSGSMTIALFAALLNLASKTREDVPFVANEMVRKKLWPAK